MQDDMDNVLFKFEKENEWLGNSQVLAKGYAFDSLGQIHTGHDLAMLFINITSPDDLSRLARELNGLFCVVGTLDFGAFALTDRIRSFPLFYTNILDQLVVSDSPYGLVDNPVLESLSNLEFKTAGYTLGRNTLFKDVYQVEAASFVIYKNKCVSLTEYYNYTTTFSVRKDYLTAKNELKILLDGCMRRMVKSLRGAPVAIPLSGGYDSRLILAWLKINGYSDLVAFTYGRKDNPDMLFAEKVASKLNTPWICLPYDDIIPQLSEDSSVDDYVLYASGASSMPFFQDYPAIKLLNEKGLIPSGSVVVPGHLGDFIAGSHLMPNDDLKTPMQLAKSIFNIHHNHFKVSKAEKKLLVKKHFDFFDKYSQSEPYSVLEWWNFKERQAKFIVNSSRAYQFFGYDTRLPFFDIELVEFFRTLPFEFKLYKKIYNEVLEDEYFKPLGIFFPDELQPKPFDYRKKLVKEYIKNTLPILKNYSKQRDSLCYHEISNHLFERYKYLPDPHYRRNLVCSPIIDWYMSFLRKKIE